MVSGGLRVGDAHGHVNPVKGMGPERLAERFKESGGWFMGLASLLSWSHGGLARQVDDYIKVFRACIKAGEAFRKAGLRCAVIIGVHPAELVQLVNAGLSVEEAKALVLDAYRAAARLVEEGLAHGLGEVGRPHFPTRNEVAEACNEVFEEVLTMAHDLDCVVHVHVERRGTSTVLDVAQRASRRGARKVLLHHAEPWVWGKARSVGLACSIPARRRDLVEALSGRGPPGFMVESDFLDDPRRPGAVVAPWSIASTFTSLIEEGVLSEKEAARILVDEVSSFYGVEPP